MSIPYSFPTRIVEVMKTARKFLELVLRPGDNVLIIADTATDPVIWQAVMAESNELGCEPTLAIYTPREYEQAEPTKPVAAAINEADVVITLTSTQLAHSKALVEFEKKKPAIFLEKMTTEALTSGAVKPSIREMDDFAVRIRKAWDSGKNVHVTSEFGTDLRVEVRSGEIDRSRRMGGKTHYDPVDGRRYANTYPAGEVGVTPVEGTGEGVVVWDLLAHHYPKILKDPIRLTIKKGRVIKIEGGTEAKLLEQYIEKYGDENSYNCPAEISIGVNPDVEICENIRILKKMYGSCHIAIGQSDIGGTVKSKLHLDGIIQKPTIKVDGRTIVEKGKILV
jgi:2,5-dihydroxypyridine 5,6-dioxygenase